MKVPTVGESITEVTISTWLKKDGDFVQLDDIIAEVESDKATFELPAEATGILRIVAQEKTTLPIGGLICKIEIAEGAPASAKAPAAAQLQQRLPVETVKHMQPVIRHLQPQKFSMKKEFLLTRFRRVA
jgi:2-oxoglutarate dehydrogenase E2 component (dihydrolipoamide succinyltransferase)